MPSQLPSRYPRYDRAAQTLTIGGKLEDDKYNQLLACYGTHADRAVIHGVLRELRDRSVLYIPEDELHALETYARRIRGEIFFAQRWMIVEGQAEYLFVHGLGRGLGYDLDEHGVSVIDAQNNGNPGTFAALARALSIPWLAVVDGDDAGRRYVQSIIDRGFDKAFVTERCKTLSAGRLEQQLLADGLEPELRQILKTLDHADALSMDLATLEKRLDKTKTRYAAVLGERLSADAELAKRMPLTFQEAIVSLRGLT